MRVVHWAMWGPRKSGLYECTKDQIKYERKHGIDSLLGLMDIDKPTTHLIDDGWLSPATWDECKNADIYVIHRGVPETLTDEKKRKKNVFVIHGTAEFLMLEEVASNAEKTAFNTHINLLAENDACIAVNQHDYDIYKIYDGKNILEMIHDAIDVERYTIEGYQHPFVYHPQILFCDSLRINKHPAHVIWAMHEVLKRLPEARLSVVGLSLISILTWRNLILRSPGQCLTLGMENIQLMTDEVRPYMRGADILVNGNVSGVPSRVELEAMASGCQVISYAGDFTKYHPKPFDIKDLANKICDCWEAIKDNRPAARLEVRKWVVENANMEKQVVDKYIPLYKRILK